MAGRPGVTMREIREALGHIPPAASREESQEPAQTPRTPSVNAETQAPPTQPQTGAQRVRLDDLTSDQYDALHAELAAAEARADRYVALLAEHVTLTDALHRACGRHDVLGANYTCAGCELADRTRTALKETDR